VNKDISNPPLPDTKPDDPGCIIFTSGSTRKPKGLLNKEVRVF
jgi:long-subunit acyl-CoA synthetase (AMP-forming)